MKVQITAESKKVITLALLEPAKRIVSEMKDDPTPLAELGKSASRIASRTCGCFEILKATAEISRNSRIWLQYGDGTEDLDIWLEFMAYDSYYGFYEIGVYLSDLWSADGTEETADNIRSHMFINAFTRKD